jgi:hypothetical protein
MDVIASVAFELSPAATAAAGSNLAGALGTPAMYDIAQFNSAYAMAKPPEAVAPPAAAKVSNGESAGFRSVVATLENLNGHAESMGTKALELKGEMKPGDMLMMTMRAHEFLFHCELTSNVANRSSEGVQQLFREQT